MTITVITSQQTKAQDYSPKNILKTNIVTPIVKTYSLTYERVVSKRASVLLTASYSASTVDGGFFVIRYATKQKGFTVMPEYRIYPLHEQPVLGGFFVASFLRYRRFKLEVQKDVLVKPTAKWQDVGAGLKLGYQWLIGRGLAIEAFIGSGYSYGSLNIDEGAKATEIEFALEPLGSSFFLQGGISPGVTF